MIGDGLGYVWSLEYYCMYKVPSSLLHLDPFYREDMVRKTELYVNIPSVSHEGRR